MNSEVNTNKNDMRLNIGVLTGYCNVKSPTLKRERGASDYFGVGGDKKELENIEHLIC